MTAKWVASQTGSSCRAGTDANPGKGRPYRTPPHTSHPIGRCPNPAAARQCPVCTCFIRKRSSDPAGLRISQTPKDHSANSLNWRLVTLLHGADVPECSCGRSCAAVESVKILVHDGSAWPRACRLRAMEPRVPPGRENAVKPAYVCSAPWTAMGPHCRNNQRPVQADWYFSLADFWNMVDANARGEVLLALLTQLDRRRDPHRIRRCDSLATGRIQK